MCIIRRVVKHSRIFRLKIQYKDKKSVEILVKLTISFNLNESLNSKYAENFYKYAVLLDSLTQK